MSGHDEESLETDSGATPEAEAKGPFRWRARHTVYAVVGFVVVAVLVSSLISIPYYAITPGTAQSVEALINVPKGEGHTHKGEVLLVDVELTPLKAIEWPYFKLQSDAQIVPSSELLGPATTAQYQAQGVIDMSDAQQAATVVALRHLGYSVRVSSTGALVYGIDPGSPAAAALQVGQVITEVDGNAIHTADDLGAALETYKPGTTVSLRLTNEAGGDARTIHVRLSEFRVEGKGDTATLTCPVWGTGTKYKPYEAATKKGGPAHTIACVGLLSPYTNYRISNLPFKVDLSNEGIIGPSAGLAFTLGLMQRLDPDDLTGGHLVAATGTMSITGAIGDVGGVAQKTVAVRNAGAKIFFVPTQEYKVALAHAGNGLKVYEVSNISQVLNILETKYDGRVPAPQPTGSP